MLNFFKPKEFTETLKGLEEFRKHFREGPVLEEVLSIVGKRIRNSEKVIVDAVKKGGSPEVIAISEVANVSGDLVEGGTMHIYRGVLGLAGQAMMELHKAAYQRLVDVGACTPEKRDEEIAALMKNVRFVG